MANKTAEEIWNKVRGDNPEFAAVDPDFRARLNSVYAEAQRGGPESGIAGLEEFEKEARAGVTATGSSAGQVTTRDAVAAQADSERSAEPTPKGSGSQDAEEKALQDAAGAGQKVESSEVHSPSRPSAARPLAAEAPGSPSNPLPDDVSDDGDKAASSGEEGEDLSALTVSDLKERAKAAGVTGYSSMPKDDLVAAVEKAETGYSAYTVAELKDKARERGVKGFSSMSKDDLVSALEDADKEK